VFASIHRTGSEPFLLHNEAEMLEREVMMVHRRVVSVCALAAGPDRQWMLEEGAKEEAS
jgi:hypothetical protein